MEKYFLMDLERTLATGIPCYWKGNRHGYTRVLKDAGIFSKEDAERIVKMDVEERTVKIPYKLIFDLGLKKLLQNEGE